MSTIPSEPIEVSYDTDTLCRWGICAAWRLSIVWGALVSLLSWTGGAEAATSVIRGLVTFFAFGLVGWGMNAVMAQAGAHTGDAARQEAGAAPQPAGGDTGAAGDAGAARGADDGPPQPA